LPSPLALLDLSVVTFALVLFDTVLVQPGRSVVSHQSHFGTSIRQLTYDRKFIVGPLWSLCGQLMRKLDDDQSPLRRSLTKVWKDLLDRDDIQVNADIIDREQDSPYDWDGVPATHFFTLGFDISTSDSQSLGDFLSVQTIRALYNDNFAGMLGVPYLS